MTKLHPTLFALFLALALSAPVPALAAGGKSSKQHEEARAAKQAADKADAEKPEVQSTKPPAGDQVEKKKVWTRAIRHKQTMPPAPNLGDADSKYANP